MIINYVAADNYSCDAYGASAYGECTTQSTSPQNPGTGTGTDTGGGMLGNTGYQIIIPLAIAGALIIAGIILIVKKVLRKKKQ